ncbi:uncharacterized protein O3C94_018590 [Discoglossus pictus]
MTFQRLQPFHQFFFELNYCSKLFRNPPKEKHKVGIFSKSPKIDCEWLQNVLQSEYFSEQVEEVKHIDISRPKHETSGCTFAILYITRHDFDFQLDLKSKLARDSAIAVIGDQEDINLERMRILEAHPNIRKHFRDLFLFNRDDNKNNKKWSSLERLIKGTESQPYNVEKTEETNTGQSRMPKDLQESQSHDVKKTEEPNAGQSQMPKEPQEEPELKLPYKITTHIPSTWPKKVKIGIFSRSGQQDYNWLMKILGSHNIRPHYISNNGVLKFYNAVDQCEFGILYHTKSRGRVNVTDVIDSLYDEELEHLSNTLKKDNVLVVIDDLDDSSKEEKARILKSQPSIERLAKNLVLVNEKEKKEYEKNLPL